MGFNKVETNEIKKDNVNHPDHYQQSGIETIDYIESLGKEVGEGFCIGNVIKYVSRYKKKNGIEDLKKAKWYLERAISVMEQ